MTTLGWITMITCWTVVISGCVYFVWKSMR